MKKIVFSLLVVVAAVGLSVWLVGSQLKPSTSSSAKDNVVNVSAGTTAGSVPAIEPVVTSVKNIDITKTSFEPSALTIKAGDKVVWTNSDKLPHRVVIAGGAESPKMPQRGVFQYVFDKPGEYAYNCAINPKLKGKIVVTQ